MTIDDMREAWEFALAEIDAAISYLEVERKGADCFAENAANSWLATLYRDRTEYSTLLARHPVSQNQLVASA